MTKVCFFNFYHNGDLLHSKPFVREVVRALGKDKVLYGHNCSSMVIKDLGIESMRLDGISAHIKFAQSDEQNMLFVNTWIGSYFDVFEGECTLKFNMKMWHVIYTKINSIFNTNLQLGPIEDYLPYINYTDFDLRNVNDYLDRDNRKKVLFSNGPALSGQCEYNGLMTDIIATVSALHSDKTFIVTHSIRNELMNVGYALRPNVIHIADIIRSEQCDLNEIGYLASFCDLIIGRNSGPFCFASTGNNLNDPFKTFYAFGGNQSDCFSNGIQLRSKYIFEKFQSKEQLKESIIKLVQSI